MKNKIWLAINLFVLAAVVFFVFGERGNAQRKDIWEYKTDRIVINESGNPESDLNYQGQNGWELVTINSVPNQTYSLAVFKRKR